MGLKKVIQPDYREGVDRKLLNIIRDRFLLINQRRLERTQQALPLRHQATLDLLPLFFQVNHPLLPGYVSRDTPRSVANYVPDKLILRAAQGFSKTFKYKAEKRLRPDILSLFMMGSIGTIAQSEGSDIDIWLCHRSGLNKNEFALLRRKADLITEWADELGLEIHFFLMDANHFRQRQLGGVDKESSGSAQHFLLLDEFYRTSVLLAGCYPLWWLIPVCDENEYDKFAELLTQKRFIRETDVIDFGGLAHIPKEEFVGAGMWQLYKGIDAPYKSVIKLLLTELYAQELPDKLNLSLEYKQAIYNDELDADDLDPYVMLYRRLERYLKSRDEQERLELIRRSFYLKVGNNLTRNSATKNASWQRNVMARLVKDWQWPEALLKTLDHRNTWGVPQVIKERKAVVSELTHSYRFLSQFARTHHLKAHINADDMAILGRKLYAVFQRKAGKVELINSGIAPTLHEDHLAFHHQSSQPLSADANGWLLYRELDSAADVAFHPVLKRSTSIVELIAWCYFNGIVSKGTRLSLVSGKSTMTMFELQNIINTFNQLTPYPLPPVPQVQFRQNHFPLHTLLFVNVGVDPMAEHSARGVHKLSDRNDSLGYSAFRENLVTTLDQISLNSWHELSVQRYELGDTLIQCLKHYLASLVEVGDHPMPRFDVRCFCPNRAVAIAKRVKILFTDVVDAFFSAKGILPVRYIIEMDHRFFVVQFVNQQPRLTGYDNLALLMRYLEQPQSSYAPIVVDRYALLDQPKLKLVFEKSRSGTIQVFFYVRKTEADLYIVDEYGSLFSYSTPYHSHQSLLIPLYRFLTSILERRQMHQSIDAFFADLVLEFCEIKAGKGEREYRVEKKQLFTDATAFFVDVQAIGNYDGVGELLFDIYCDEQEFSVLEYGDQLIPAVAHYIHSKRTLGEPYPCYLTDLGLPQRLDQGDYQVGLQTVQYLQYKKALEDKLNEALQLLAG
ncbi:class I adenylate cyclase [Alkalimarinus alittae]|uniref:Class I adenylate cyclase n=1 Tax=Alkalimarinus alittae TaxID=2961619 RepID=A0ABY6N380_9ALTE|nr:class I adenylate cyclase [Alkalimarinus alittae]UZE96457.1 class I adenylate cyclase [Alkalimarinus alittae]